VTVQLPLIYQSKNIFLKKRYGLQEAVYSSLTFQIELAECLLLIMCENIQLKQ